MRKTVELVSIHPLNHFFILISFCLVLSGCENKARKALDAKKEKAYSQVRQIATELDKKTTKTGSYIRIEEDEMKEKDPWGTEIKVSYSQGGVAETLDVISAGPDKNFYTNDDISAGASTTNFKGVGEGIKNNIEEVSKNSAKGVVKGTVEGVKESIKESIPFKFKKKDKNKDSEDSETEEAKEEDPKTEETKSDDSKDEDPKSDESKKE